MGTNNSSLQLTNIHDYIYLFLDKNLPPSTPVKKGATPKVSEVNVRDISVIESTPANLLKKSLLRKAMEGVEEEKVRMPHYLFCLFILLLSKAHLDLLKDSNS